MRYRYSYSLISRVIGAVVQTVVLSLTARSLNHGNFATYAISIAVAQVISVVTEFGFSTRVLRRNAETAPGAIMGILAVSRAVTTLVVLVSLLVLGVAQNTLLISLLCGLYATGEVLGDLAGAIYQGELRARRTGTLLILRRVLAVLPLTLAWILGTSSPVGVYLSLGAAGVGGHVIFWLCVRRRWERPAPVRTTFVENLPLMLASGGTNLTQADSILVRLVSNVTLTANYAAASRLSNPINLAVSTLVQVLIPELSTMRPASRRRAFRKARRLVVAAAACISLVSLGSGLIVRVLYGPGYAETAPILAGVLIGAGVSAWSQLHLAYLYVVGLRASESVTLIAATVVGLVVLTSLVASLGAAGAAIGYVGMELCISVAITLLWRRRWVGIRRA